MISTYDFLSAEAISHLNSVKGIIGHLEERTRAGDEDARQVLDSLGITLRQFKFTGSPATGKNLNPKDGPSSLNGSPESKPDLNYFAPKKILQDMLLMEWFDEASADKKKFTKEWRNQMLEELMVSDCRDEVAKAWANKDLRLQVKGHVMGAMTKGGAFLKNKYTPIARIYYGTREDTKESITLAKYMGEYVKTYYGEWIKTYVERSK